VWRYALLVVHVTKQEEEEEDVIGKTQIPVIFPISRPVLNSLTFTVFAGKQSMCLMSGNCTFIADTSSNVTSIGSQP